ncbi:beta-glucosidase family protein [Lacticaseibacillus songhuajiangensis]|uniref:beta-glucosidase family protein n=1 Tax=Lacticaseibacillus songhuajiangensis TaxID=1296539 RepID=UPI000F7B79A3|nr:glycoside hydrolase family 3 C-terminal domain-containing protein [Lacticaseibacillus songhuajiangensis]
MNQKIDELLASMTLDEKVALCVGKDFWHTQDVQRLGVASTVLTDGPHGIRKQVGTGNQLGLGESVKAICFPTGSAIAASFDPNTSELVGSEIGKLARKEQIGVVLGPAMNIKRSPLCGRNFEYYSEDPLVSGQLATGAVRGIQGEGIAACLKHFVANNQEYYRQTANSVVDEQTLREIYLAPFEYAVKHASPNWVMSSYNRVNGEYVSQSHKLLTDILRKEWNFRGAVVSDWGASDDTVASLAAGMDLCMPGPAADNVAALKRAVTNGELSEETIDLAVARILLSLPEQQAVKAQYDFAHGHMIAEKAATESAVLLKNDDDILPLQDAEKIALIGQYAKVPRYQGGGSSHINAAKVTSAFDVLGKRDTISYAQGYDDDGILNEEVLINEAVKVAASADKAVIFAGLPEVYETEAVDRSKLAMPANQNALIKAVAAVQPNTVVVLHNGSPVTMPWLGEVKAVLEMYLGGEAVGAATVALLYGEVNPSGRLAETFPLRVEDTPAYPYYGIERDDVPYREGNLVGYRYYDTMHRAVLFPFGHGLSYTSFAYSDLRITQKQIDDTQTLKIQVNVTNTGHRFGKEVVQLYVANPVGDHVRPQKELCAFTKVALKPNETKKVSFELDYRAFAEWNVQLHDWLVSDGPYTIQIARSASDDDVLLTTPVSVVSTRRPRQVFDVNTPLGDFLADPAAKDLVIGALHNMLGARADKLDADDSGDESGALSHEAMLASAAAMPLRALVSFSENVSREQLLNLVDQINRANAKEE